MQHQGVNSYYELVLGGLIYWGNADIRAVEISADEWCEIDDMEDLKRAEEKFGTMIYKAETEVQGTVDVDKKYIDRVREGFNQVITDGLGYGYMGYYMDSSGKTGTSQSFIDTNGDGVVDTETITSSFVGYSPSENPRMSVVVVSPDISHSYGSSTYQSAVTKRISANTVNKFFEIYK